MLILAAPPLQRRTGKRRGKLSAGQRALRSTPFAEAAAAYGHAIEQDPQFLEAYYNRALADEMVDRQKAMAEWRRFADLAANAPDFK